MYVWLKTYMHKPAPMHLNTLTWIYEILNVWRYMCVCEKACVCTHSFSRQWILSTQSFSQTHIYTHIHSYILSHANVSFSRILSCKKNKITPVHSHMYELLLSTYQKCASACLRVCTCVICVCWCVLNIRMSHHCIIIFGYRCINTLPYLWAQGSLDIRTCWI